MHLTTSIQRLFSIKRFGNRKGKLRVKRRKKEHFDIIKARKKRLFHNLYNMEQPLNSSILNGETKHILLTIRGREHLNFQQRGNRASHNLVKIFFIGSGSFNFFIFPLVIGKRTICPPHHLACSHFLIDLFAFK